MKRSNKEISSEKDLRQWRLAGKVAAGLQWLQRKWADGMNRGFARLSPLGRKIAFLCFFLGMSVYCSLLVASAFKKGVRLIDAPVKFSVPDVIRKMPALPATPNQPLFLLPIKRFRHYLDSLSHTESGRLIRDSLLRTRPGLLDSIRQIEKIYCKQKSGDDKQMDK